MHHTLSTLLQQPAETAAVHPWRCVRHAILWGGAALMPAPPTVGLPAHRGARLHRQPPAQQNAVNQLLPLPLRAAQTDQLPPHLRNTEMQPTEYCTRALQNQAAILIPRGHVQQVIDKGNCSVGLHNTFPMA